MNRYKRLRTYYWICKRKGVPLLIFFGILSLLAWMMLWSSSFGIGRLDIIDSDLGLRTIQLIYSSSELEMLLAMIGESGRMHVLLAVLPILSISVIIWSFFCSLLMMCIFLIRRPLSRTPVGLWMLLIIPALTIAAAFLELLTITHILLEYPDIQEFSMHLASSAALGRSIGFFCIFALIVIGLVSAGRRSP